MSLHDALQAASNAYANYSTAASIYAADVAGGSPQPKTANDLATATNLLAVLCGTKQGVIDAFAALGC